MTLEPLCWPPGVSTGQPVRVGMYLTIAMHAHAHQHAETFRMAGESIPVTILNHGDANGTQPLPEALCARA